MAQNMRFDVGIKTTADLAGIEQIRKQLDSLRKTASSVDIKVGRDALNDINAIERALTSAFDVKLNTVNIDKFTQSLKDNSTSMGSIAKSFSQLGPEGQKTFLSLTNQTLKMGQAIKQTNQGLERLATTFKNTIKWSISSSIWKNLTTQVSGAFSYVKSLNAGLNDIRIVTGKSADEMKRFAKEANEAAKALGDSTSQYVQGALIYAQQGLDDKAIKERTDVTMKMVNVTGDAAEEVSSYMTAIWNNFDDGSQSVEHFGDVITSLGATTAASTAEIAAGLERFAAVANTVGLSYDYATSALATVVAETRQSADVVGTAFRTLFARIQDLELGETLDDGTTLGKYSQALEKIGIDIKNANGSMKDMDQILNEMGAKWSTLSSDVQVATAQAVAGTRQYSQLIALMDNWDKMQQNLVTAQSANGILQRQNEIYLDSIDAKMKRLKASGEALKSSLIDEDAVASGVEALTAMANGLTTISDSLGGLAGIIPLVMGGLVSAFSGPLSADIANVTGNLSQFKDQATSLQTLKDSLNMGGDENSAVLTNAANELVDAYEKINHYKDVIGEKDAETINAIGEQVLLSKQLVVEQDSLSKKMAMYADAYDEAFSSLDVENPTEQFRLIEGLKFNIQDLEKAMASISAQSETWREDLLDATRFDDTGTEIKKMQAAITSAKGIKEARAAIIEYCKGLSMAVEEAHRFSKVQSDVKIEQERANNALSSFTSTKDLQAQYQGVLRMAGAFSQLAFAVQSVKNIGSIWADKDAKLGDKILKTVIAMSAVLGTLTRTVKDFQAGIKAIKDSFNYDKELVTAKAVSDADKERLDKLIAIAKVEKDITAEKAKQLLHDKEAAIAAEEKRIADLESLKTLNVKGTKAERKKYNAVRAAVGYDPDKAKMARGDWADAQIANSKARIADLEAEKEALGQLPEAMDAAGKSTKRYNELHTNASKNIVSNFKKMIASVAAFIAQNAILAVASAAILGVAAAAVYAYKKHKQAIVDAGDAQQKYNENVKKHREELQAEADDVKNLVDSYESLKDQYSSQADGLKTVQMETYKLLLEHKKSSEAVKALTADYEQLDAIMKTFAEDTNSRVFESAGVEVSAAERAIRGQLKSQVSEDGFRLDNFGKTIDLKGIGWGHITDKKETALIDRLKDLGGEDLFTDSGHMSLEKFSTLAIEEREKLQAILSESGTEFGTQLLGYLNGVSEVLDNYADAQKAQKDSATAYYGKDLVEGIKDTETYLQKVQELKAKTLEFYDNPEDAEAAAKLYFSSMTSSIDNLTDYIKNAELGKALEDAGKTFTYAQIEGLTDAEKTFMLQSVSFMTENTIDEFLKTWGTVVDAIQKQDYVVQVKAILQGMVDNNGQVDGNALKDYYTSKGLSNESYADALVMDEDALRTQLLYMYAEDAKYLHNHQEEIAQAFDDELDAWKEKNEKQLNIAEHTYKELESKYDKIAKIDFNDLLGENNLFSQNEDFIFEQLSQSSYETAERNVLEATAQLDEAGREELKQQFSEMYSALAGMSMEQITQLQELVNRGVEVSKDTIRNAMNELLDAYTGNGNDLEAAKESLSKESSELLNAFFKPKDLERMVKGTSAYKTLTSQLEDLTAQVEKAKAGADWRGVVQAAKEAEDSISTALDNIQSAYSNLTTAQEEYAETGYISIDSMQNILNMSPEYLEALELEGGKFKFNEEVLKKLTIARIEDLKYAALQEAQAELEDILSKDKTDTAWAEFKAKTGLVNVTHDLTIEMLDNLDVRARSLDLTDSEIEAVHRYVEAKKKQIQAMNLAEEGVKKNGLGKGKTITPKDLIDNEADYYWNQKKAIEATEHALNKLQKAQEHLKGKALLKNLKDQNVELNKQKENYEALLNRQRQRQKEMQKDLKSHGVTFDGNGQVSNYDAAFKKATDEYNAAIKAYNKSGNEEAYKAAKERYDQFKDLMSEYTSLVYSEMNETEDMIAELRQKAADALFDEMHFEIQAKIDTTQAKRDWNAFLKEFSNMDVSLQYKDLKRMTDYYRQDAKDVRTQTKKKQEEAEKIQQEIDKFATIENYGQTEGAMFTSIDDAKEALKSVNNELMDYSLELQNIWEGTWKTYLEGIDQSADRFADIISEYDRMGELLDFERQVIELNFGTTKEGKELMDEYYKQREKASIGEVDSLAQQKDLWEELYKQADEGSADRAKYYDLFKKAESDLNNAVIDHIKLLKEDYANTINNIMDDLEKSLNNGFTTKQVQEEWEAASWEAEHYLDNVEKIYSIQTLENKINGSIASQKQLKNQQKLQAFYDRELTYLREKEKLTQFDLDAANAHYDIIMKEIALEEAQQSKNSMKLSRSADGNWSYQYVADEDQVTSARQDLLDSYNNLYQLADSAYQKNLSSLNELNDKYLSSLRELNQQLLNNEITVEEYNERRDKLTERYYEHYNALAQENSKIQAEAQVATVGLLLEAYDQDTANFDTMTDDQKKIVTEAKKHQINEFLEIQGALGRGYGEIKKDGEGTYADLQQAAETCFYNTNDFARTTAQEMLTKWQNFNSEADKDSKDNWLNNPDSIKNVISQAFDDMDQKRIDFEGSLESLEEASHLHLTDPTGVKGDLDTIGEGIEDLADDTTTTINSVKKDLEDYKKAVDKVTKSYELQKTAIEEAKKALDEYLAKEEKVAESEKKVNDPGKNDPSKDNDKGNDKPIAGTQKTNTEQSKGWSAFDYNNKNSRLNDFGTQSDLRVLQQQLEKAGYIIDQSSIDNTNQKVYARKAKYAVQDDNGTIISKHYDTEKEALSELRKIQKEGELLGIEGVQNFKIKKFDTGGYTGDWYGNDGKLALLHQKEMVLNADDTKDILDTVNVVRNLKESIGKETLQQLSGIKSGSSSIVNNSNSTTSNLGDTFYVNAEFPNAENVNEIREALLSLPLLAQQYKNRK